MCEQDRLMTCLRRVLRRSLDRLAWPPPIASTSSSEAADQWHGFENGDPQVDMSTTLHDWTHMCAARAPCLGCWGLTFYVCGLQALAELNGILAALIALQRSVQRSSFEAVSAQM